MARKFNSLFSFVPLAFVCLLAVPAQAPAAETPVPRAGKKQSFQITFHFPPKGERWPVPLQFVNNVPLFQAEVNGTQVWAALDNRVMASLIDLDFARQADIALGPVTTPFKTPIGSLEHRRAQDVQVQIPGQIRFSAPFSVVDLSTYEKVTGRPVSLVVGYEYFSKLAFFVRPSKGSLQIGPSGSVKASASIRAVPLISDRPLVDVRVGETTLSLTLDLGYNGDIALTPDAWSKLKLDRLPATFGKGGNLGGETYDVKYVELASARIGPFTVEDVTASLRPTMLGDQDGLLGMGFLRRFDFALDIDAGKLWLIEPKGTAPAVGGHSNR